MLDIWQRLKTEKLPILLYGTGNGADKILNELNRLGISVSGVFASDGFVRERTYRGFKVTSLTEAETFFGDFIALFSFGSDRLEVLENIKRIMQKHTLLAPEVPVAGGDIFNIEYARAHSDELSTIYNLLADDLSRKTFEQTVLFKLDGDISRLFDCETDKNEPYANILKLKNGSSFLDLGAYNGDTVLDFINRVPDFSHITALEPDIKSFKKLEHNLVGYNVKKINAAVFSHSGKVIFSKKESRGSTINNGTELIDCIAIDDLLIDGFFDYIKIDVEGSELEAVYSAKKTIENGKTNFKIAAYHKSNDYFDIPLKFLSFNSNYKLYMRHTPAVPAWDTDFYFIAP